MCLLEGVWEERDQDSQQIFTESYNIEMAVSFSILRYITSIYISTEKGSNLCQ